MNRLATRAMDALYLITWVLKWVTEMISSAWGVRVAWLKSIYCLFKRMAPCTMPKISALNMPIRFIIPFMHQFSCMNYDRTVLYSNKFNPFFMVKYQKPPSYRHDFFVVTKQHVIGFLNSFIQNVQSHMGRRKVESVEKNYGLCPKSSNEQS